MIVIGGRIGYIHIPKTGGTMIRKVAKKEGFRNVGYIHNTYRHKCCRNADVPLFVTVRNPWAWYVSYYFFKRQGKPGPPCVKSVARKSDFETFLKWFMGKKRKKSAHFFNWRFTNNHDIGPFSWLFLRASVKSFSSLGPENFGIDQFVPLEDSGALCEILKVDSLPVINKTRHQDYRSYYNEEMIELVRRKDRVIVDLFGYDFESSPSGVFNREDLCLSSSVFSKPELVNPPEPEVMRPTEPEMVVEPEVEDVVEERGPRIWVPRSIERTEKRFRRA